MEIKLLIIIILAAVTITIAIIVISSLLFPQRFSIFLKEACLLTVAKLFSNPKVCEVFRIAE